MDVVDLTYALVGLGALLAGVIPRLLGDRPLSMPIVFLCFGVILFAFPIDLPDPDPLKYSDVTLRITEIGVIVALMGAGLKLDRPLGWRSWSSTWRLLAIAMPLTIVATALLGAWAGFGAAAATLLAAALAPTDPVLASDVQVDEPGGREDGEDEVRFALTSEAGFNDALAFPFVYAAIAMAAHGTEPAGWIGEWLAVDVVYKTAAGIALGVLTGRLLGWLFFRPKSKKWHLASHAEGFLVLAATFIAYGATEVIGAYGFLAVFVCALSIRASEREHEYHRVLHDFAEQIERLLTVLLLVLFGGAIVRGLLDPLTWKMAVVGVLVVAVVRPVTAWLAMSRTGARPGQRAAIAMFGIRGIGSFYYLTYALTEEDFAAPEALWATLGFVVLLSVIVHGVAATPVMARLDRRSRCDESGLPESITVPGDDAAATSDGSRSSGSF